MVETQVHFSTSQNRMNFDATKFAQYSFEFPKGGKFCERSIDSKTRRKRIKEKKEYAQASLMLFLIFSSTYFHICTP